MDILDKIHNLGEQGGVGSPKLQAGNPQVEQLILLYNGSFQKPLKDEKIEILLVTQWLRLSSQCRGPRFDLWSGN